MATSGSTIRSTTIHFTRNGSARERAAEADVLLSDPRSANSFDWSITTSTRDDRAL
ncbi:hypothetical protein Pla52nx_005655 [Stieleria varia]|uniref:hypothetical protein n=1 Tax=Stieleria varia TaxID=2528005 RepID=UPI00313D3D24